MKYYMYAMFVSVTYSCPHNIFCWCEIDTWLDRCSMTLLYAILSIHANDDKSA